MERGLHERDRVGVQDFVLLEDFQSETAFVDNLKKRFNENLIYVSVYLSSLVRHDGIKFIAEILPSFNFFFIADLHRPGTRVCEPVQKSTDLYTRNNQ